MTLLPVILTPLKKTSAETLEFPRLLELVAGYATTEIGHAWVAALAPSADASWAEREQQRAHEVRALLAAGTSFDFHGLIDPGLLLEQAGIPGAILEMEEIRALAVLVDRIAAWQRVMATLTDAVAQQVPGVRQLSSPLHEGRFTHLLRVLEGKFESDGSIADNASPARARMRRQMERQHRNIEDSLHSMLRRMGETGGAQEDWITVRGERFVIPVKAEWKRRIPGVMHGASSSGQTVFVEPLETIEQNNELQRMLDDEQAEIRRILAEMTRAFAEHAEAIASGALILAEVESLFARARFAVEFNCTIPKFFAVDDAESRLELKAARHPLLERRLRVSGGAVVPLDMDLDSSARQLIISGPNTGGKTVALKTTGLLALMAQAGIPVPAEEAHLPLLAAVRADIGDAQSS